MLKSRWIDINKGGDENPNYRSRLVGEEFNEKRVDGLFAATPRLFLVIVLGQVWHKSALSSFGFSGFGGFQALGFSSLVMFKSLGP